MEKSSVISAECVNRVFFGRQAEWFSLKIWAPFFCLFVFKLKKKNYLFIIWLHRVLVAAGRLLSCGMHVGSSSLTRDRTWPPLHWGRGVSTTAPPGKSVAHFGLGAAGQKCGKVSSRWPRLGGSSNMPCLVCRTSSFKRSFKL